ncbi:hypothetical protein Taro_054909 [Colocasia esculenta]|uniref:Uncharacterized protein n=1 Tax=Colocasia esculenta TaxID=4460 RepID=A0A843XPY1_COLES|nr:hypothetical protein [Colocasia esculenta]
MFAHLWTVRGWLFLCDQVGWCTVACGPGLRLCLLRTRRKGRHDEQGGRVEGDGSGDRHHVTEEHVIEEDEEDEIDSQDDIDDNENIDEGDDEPLFDIARVNNTEIEYEQDPPDIFTSDQWIDEAMLNSSHEGIDVPNTLEGEEPHGFPHCRPLISVRGTHLYGKYPGVLMIATAVDADDGLFPLTFVTSRHVI